MVAQQCLENNLSTCIRCDCLCLHVVVDFSLDFGEQINDSLLYARYTMLPTFVQGVDFSPNFGGRLMTF